MNEHAAALADAIEAVLPVWVERSVERIMLAWRGAVDDAEVAAEGRRAGEKARAEIGPRIRALLETDIDEQRTTPLSILREAIVYPAAVLAAAGVPPVERDSFAEERFPNDVYGLTPATFADIDPELADVGIAWGAAKALAHRQRHMGGSG